MIDFHVHPDYSSDGSGTIEEYARRAEELGLTDICFVPHFDADPVRGEGQIRLHGQLVALTSDWMDYYLADIEKAQQRCPEVRLHAGLEVGYAPELESWLAGMLSRWHLDYLIGSVHMVDHMALSVEEEAQEIFSRFSLGEIARRYFEALGLAAESGLFDVIGHFDLYKRYGLITHGPAVLEMHDGLAGPVLQAMARNGVGVEVNTAVLRYGHAEPYPSKALLDEARKCGVSVVTVGSDAHQVAHLGAELERGVAFAHEAGFSTISRFSARKAEPTPL